jgi:hypothetical protein
VGALYGAAKLCAATKRRTAQYVGMDIPEYYASDIILFRI